MPDVPITDAGGSPGVTEGPIEAAQRVLADPASKGSPEWLAATELLKANDVKARSNFSELEREMQALRGMSEI